MSFGHERLDVYRAAIEYVGWAYRYCEALKGHRNAKDQLLRASQAIPLNIAEGNGKATDGDRRRYFEIARGSALECGAIQDVLEVCGALSAEDNAKAKAVLDPHDGGRLLRDTIHPNRTPTDPSPPAVVGRPVNSPPPFPPARLRSVGRRSESFLRRAGR